MPLNVQLVNAQVKDPQSGQMTPAGLIGSDAISTINTAKNQAIAAVQQKGEETLQSIPDDYTALSNEVDDLKTQLNEIGTFIPITEIAGKLVRASDGALISSLSYTSYQYLIYGLDSLTITPYFTNDDYGFAFYDKTGNFVENSGGVYSDSGSINISVPMTAYYIKFCSNNLKTHAKINADWGKLIALSVNLDSTTARVAELENNSQISTQNQVKWYDMNADGTTGYLNTSGNPVDYANEYLSELTNIDPTKNIEYNVAYIYGLGIAIAFYDVDGAFIPGSGIIAPSGTSGTFAVAVGTTTPPSNAKFIRYTMSVNSVGGISKGEQYIKYYKPNSLKDVTKKLITDAESPWYGKKWCAFGTSITDTNFVNPESGEVTGKYVPFLETLSGANVSNRGIAGGTIGSGGIHGGSSTILNAILNSTDLDSFDLITLEGFVNDFAASVSIGDIGDTANTTMYGALYQAVTYILENSHAELVLITETTGKEYTMSGGSVANYNVLRKNSLNLYQQDYNNVIIKIGQMYGVHVIDAGGKSQINQYHPEYIIDHIHHTTLGGEQYAKTIWEELKNIRPSAVAQP